MKKAISLLLCAIMTVSLCVPVFAAKGKTASEDIPMAQDQLGTQAAAKKPVNILMVGNSYTYCNDQNLMLQAICKSVGIKAKVDKFTIGGSTFEKYADPKSARGKKLRSILKSRAWDYVILQDRHFNPITQPDVLREAAYLLCHEIRAVGAQPVLLMTWAPKEGHRDYELYKDTVKDPQDYLRQIQEAYESAALKGNAIVAPVGLAFLEGEGMNLELPLMRNDRSAHPTYPGSYLSACTIFKTLFPDTPAIAFEGKLHRKPHVANTLRAIATNNALKYQQPTKTAVPA